MEFWLPLPPVPKGNSPRIIKFGGRLGVAPSKRSKWAEGQLVALLRATSKVPRVPLTCPVWRDATFVLPIAPSWPKWKREAARELRYLPPGGGRQPDVGNLVKLLDDALERARVIHNDGQIVGGSCSKVYGDQPGYLVRVTELPQASREDPSHPFVRPTLLPKVSASV